jgi:ATP/maltotriose-dependent transcriptional regulator MalT
VPEPVDHADADLERGRSAYASRRWRAAYEALSQQREPGLDADDLELLATSAYMLGLDAEYVAHLERAHHVHADEGRTLPAVRCAFWVGMNLAVRGEVGPASGWLGRAQRLLAQEGGDSAEHGYLLLPVMFRREAEADFAAAAALAGEAAAIGDRFGDRDLFALAVHAQGQMLIKDGRTAEGLALLDEAMVAATTEGLSPIVTGLVYCGVILACQAAYEVRRAREWTAVLSGWCAEQPDMLAFTGRCLVHRAEILQLGGSWTDALEEARRAGRRLDETRNDAIGGLARYREAELLRLQGDFDAAEEAYRAASRLGWEPQPGLAQLRLAQGRRDDAAASIRRAATEIGEPLKRAALLPAVVEIMLAVGSTAEARAAVVELDGLAADYESSMLAAIVAQARGAVELADGDARVALEALRRAAAVWQALEAPYEAARVRVLVGQACRARGDEDAAVLEQEAAREAFDRIGGRPDLARVEALQGAAGAGREHGLSERELEVLRLVAAGRSNREIAAALVLSEHTVARHLQNIFGKLGLSSRTAATAYAFEHDLV